MARIMIIQPYVPAYRRPLFEQLGAELGSDGHELVIVAGEPRSDQRLRQDAVELQHVRRVKVRSRSLTIGPLQIRLSPWKRTWHDADVVIVELAAGALASYRALLSGIPTGVWGHVGSYVAPDHRVLRALRAWQVRRADHVLAYTEPGAATAIAYGAEPTRVTALNNTVDTRVLRAAVLAARGRPDSDVRRELGAPEGPLVAVIGGLDESKRVDLIAATLDRLWDEGSDIRMLIGGHGRLEHLLRAAEARGQIVLLGHVDDRTKGLMARVSSVLFNPGRVGLIAVESLVMGLPILTTSGQGHGPEFDYLQPGQDSVVVSPDVDVLTRTLAALVGGGDELARLAVAAESRADQFDLDAMVSAMRSALDDLLSGVGGSPGERPARY